jgi:hypothetical protein
MDSFDDVVETRLEDMEKIHKTLGDYYEFVEFRRNLARIFEVSNSCVQEFAKLFKDGHCTADESKGYCDDCSWTGYQDNHSGHKENDCTAGEWRVQYEEHRKGHSNFQKPHLENAECKGFTKRHIKDKKDDYAQATSKMSNLMEVIGPLMTALSENINNYKANDEDTDTVKTWVKVTKVILHVVWITARIIANPATIVKLDEEITENKGVGKAVGTAAKAAITALKIYDQINGANFGWWQTLKQNRRTSLEGKRVRTCMESKRQEACTKK